MTNVENSKRQVLPAFPPVRIGQKLIGQGHPTYFIAEMSGNHAKKFDEAVAIVKAAKEAGADAVKLQTYTPDTITIKCDSDYFRIKGSLWDGDTLYDLYSKAYMPWEWQPKLKKIAHDLGLDLFSSPFDRTAVDFLELMDVPAYKIASCELVDLPLIRYVARTGKTILMSTGMATWDEIREAVEAAHSGGAKGVILLKCTSSYPAPPEAMNLKTIPQMEETFKVPVGLSDHTMSLIVPVSAVSLGACVIEKHFAVSRSHPSCDSEFSLEPSEFKAMVDAVRLVEKALGGVHYGGTDQEAVAKGHRRSLFAVENIKAGELLTEKNIRSIRPGNGLLPKYWDDVLGKKAIRDIARGTPLKWEHVA
jgi:N-acetylneuraminate synthase